MIYIQNMEKTLRFAPKNVPYLEANFLSEDQQVRYEEAVSQYDNQRARNTLSVPIKGSNLFKVLLLNQIGIRTASLPELDQIRLEDEDFLKGIYVDTPSIVLRGEGDSYELNDRLARYLEGKAKERGLDLEEPIVANGLRLRQDGNSAYGLNFLVDGETEMFEAPELRPENNYKKFTRQDERGMPIFENGGEKTFYTGSNRLSRLCLDDGPVLDSLLRYLGVSGDYGRVVVVSAGGTRAEFDDYLGKLRESKERELSDLQERYDRAESVLRGKA